MLTFQLIIAFLILMAISCFYINHKARYGSDIAFGLAWVAIIALAILMIAQVCCYNSSTNDIIAAHARMETAASYKNQDGVYFLNQNTVTHDEYEFAVRYNQWLASQKYWNKREFTDVFINDAVDTEQPIRFVIGDSRK